MVTPVARTHTPSWCPMGTIIAIPLSQVGNKVVRGRLTLTKPLRCHSQCNRGRIPYSRDGTVPLIAPLLNILSQKKKVPDAAHYRVPRNPSSAYVNVSLYSVLDPCLNWPFWNKTKLKWPLSHIGNKVVCGTPTLSKLRT